MEFDLIHRYFDRPPRHTDLAVGDDAALLTAPAGTQLVVSSDMLVEETHFLRGTDAEALGWKTLAVNVSDLAAMGATPRWTTLAISLPTPDEGWLSAFAAGFFACCETFGLDLIGGDTTRGPLNLCPTVIGLVPRGEAVKRAGGRPGDDLWISGWPGRAALALADLRGGTRLADRRRDEFIDALQRPQPRLALGLALRGVATAMLDVSDGLLGDLGHILARSRVGARLERSALPWAPLRDAGVTEAEALDALLRGGDDYELLFAAPPGKRDRVLACAAESSLAVHRIGTLTSPALGLVMVDDDGAEVGLAPRAFDHFAIANGAR